MKERTAVEVFICLTLRWQKERQRRWCKEKKAEKAGRAEDGRGESGEQVHLYVWLPSVKRSATPGLINSEKRSQSFFSPHTSTHGLAMTFTSFEGKSGSRYSTLQWSDMLRCCHPGGETAGRKEKGKEVSDTCFMLQNHCSIHPPLSISWLSLAPLFSLWQILRRQFWQSHSCLVWFALL